MKQYPSFNICVERANRNIYVETLRFLIYCYGFSSRLDSSHSYRSYKNDIALRRVNKLIGRSR